MMTRRNFLSAAAALGAGALLGGCAGGEERSGVDDGGCPG